MLITVAEVRKLTGTRPEDDEGLQDQRDSVVGLWEDLTCRLWERRVDHVYNTQAVSARTNIIWLPLWPVESITKIEHVERDGDIALIDATRYHLQGDNKVVYECGPWAQFEEIIVTFTGGYTANPTGVPLPAETPADVKRVLLRQLQFERQRFANDKIMIRSQNFEGGSGAYEKATVHPSFQALAKRKRNKRPG